MSYLQYYIFLSWIFKYSEATATATCVATLKCISIVVQLIYIYVECW